MKREREYRAQQREEEKDREKKDGRKKREAKSRPTNSLVTFREMHPPLQLPHRRRGDGVKAARSFTFGPESVCAA